jgi:uncharacterized membrane protein
MEYWFLITSAILSLVGMLFHGVVGQKVYMGNINKSEMAPMTKSLSLVSWHIFTIFLFISAATLFYVAFNPGLVVAIYPVIGINLLGSILFISLSIGKHRGLLRLPGAYSMGGTALFGWLGI